MSVRRSLKSDPDASREGDNLEFRLTYEGLLLGASNGNNRAKHKHEIRKRFHRQLKRVWEVMPQMKPNAFWPQLAESGQHLPEHTPKALGARFARNGYNFAPLVTETLGLICGVEVLFLRPDIPGKVLTNSGDIDNRLKTLFDALRMPHSSDELAGFTVPGEDETPFFVLLEDDSLISSVNVETDTLLEPLPGKEEYGANDARLVLTIWVRPWRFHIDNARFG